MLPLSSIGQRHRSRTTRAQGKAAMRWAPEVPDKEALRTEPSEKNSSVCTTPPELPMPWKGLANICKRCADLDPKSNGSAANAANAYVAVLSSNPTFTETERTPKRLGNRSYSGLSKL